MIARILFSLALAAILPLSVVSEEIPQLLTPKEPDWAKSVASNLKPHYVKVIQYGMDGERLGLSGGVVLGKEGLVATCFHSIGERRRVGVVFEDGREVAPSELVAFDVHEDIAILRMPVEMPTGVELVEEMPEAGSAIAALGNPGGDEDYLVTGVIAANVRSVLGMPRLQLSLTIESGNSGGPVVSPSGELIGLVAAKDLRRPGLGYAIPASNIRQLLEDPTPVSFDLWCKIKGLDRRHWNPDNDKNWFQRAGRVAFESVEIPAGARLCHSTLKAPEEEAFVLSADVVVQHPGVAGIAFDIEEDGAHLAWTVSHGIAHLVQTTATIESTDFDIIAKQVLVKESESPWINLRVEFAEKRMRCFANGKLCHEGPAPKFKTWGLHASRGTKAEIRNVALTPVESVEDDFRQE
ncbi:MAG: serine protease, partial [Verrucomicrobiota bacterium]